MYMIIVSGQIIDRWSQMLKSLFVPISRAHYHQLFPNSLYSV